MNSLVRYRRGTKAIFAPKIGRVCPMYSRFLLSQFPHSPTDARSFPPILSFRYRPRIAAAFCETPQCVLDFHKLSAQLPPAVVYSKLRSLQSAPQYPPGSHFGTALSESMRWPRVGAFISRISSCVSPFCVNEDTCTE